MKIHPQKTRKTHFYTRRHAGDKRFNFGTGKVNSLAGFGSAVLLVAFALFMAGERIARMLSPVKIGFNQAIWVAVIGLLVNGACLLILKGHDDEHPHKNDEPEHHSAHSDHNLWSAYLHVMADAMTSVLAIVALLAGKHFGWIWMDPLMGVIGAGLVTHWSWSLIRSSGHVLLDMEAPLATAQAIRTSLESIDDNQVADLHVRAVGPGIFAAEVGLVTPRPREPHFYRDLMPKQLAGCRKTLVRLRRTEVPWGPQVLFHRVGR